MEHPTTVPAVTAIVPVTPIRMIRPLSSDWTGQVRRAVSLSNQAQSATSFAMTGRLERMAARTYHFVMSAGQTTATRNERSMVFGDYWQERLSKQIPYFFICDRRLEAWLTLVILL